jgi:DNA mismatch repair protein MSH2
LIQRHRLYSGYYAESQEVVVREAVNVACTYYPVLSRLAVCVAELDCVMALAQAAGEYGWVCPIICGPVVVPNNFSSQGRGDEDQNPRMELIGLRHPCIEHSVGSNSFISSDVYISQNVGGAVITGPNMGGKSTFLRAVGIAVILAQIGSFVPATKARMQLFDRICIRTGAADSVAEGVSTFMNEMNDVVNMYQSVNPRSLILIDELGRGTSTHEGFGLAWSIMKSLVCDYGCTTFFATHFHELTKLADVTSLNTNMTQIINLCVRANVVESTNDVLMEYAVQRGVCARSYGVQVAKMIGFPAEIVTEATSIAEKLDSAENVVAAVGQQVTPLS